MDLDSTYKSLYIGWHGISSTYCNLYLYDGGVVLKLNQNNSAVDSYFTFKIEEDKLYAYFSDFTSGIVSMDPLVNHVKLQNYQIYAYKQYVFLI